MWGGGRKEGWKEGGEGGREEGREGGERIKWSGVGVSGKGSVTAVPFPELKSPPVVARLVK